MPTFNQVAYIRRALGSLSSQNFTAWELIIIDDGSSENTREAIAPMLADDRIHYYRFASNRGLGASLNYGLAQARTPLIAYLPSDDLYYSNHLESLLHRLERDCDAVLAYSGIRYHHSAVSSGGIEGYPLQLVQVMHRLTADRWVERDKLVTDDLDRLFWSKLAQQGSFVPTNQITCEWVDHTLQRHKIIREYLDEHREHRGGLNRYRSYYGVKHPLRFQSSVGNYIDEHALYQRFRQRSETPRSSDRLKILLVGELSHNAERILALEEHGHALYGLWTPTPAWWNTVGPLPFGHVQDLPSTGWDDVVQRLKPDVIYALLNWSAVPLAHQVLSKMPHIPFVWHFKESPFLCMENGLWPQLMDLHMYSDGQIYSSVEMHEWFQQFLPHKRGDDHILVLDGDLPKREWFVGEQSPKLSDADGQIHTVVMGRPVGLPRLMPALAKAGIHLHFYSSYYQGRMKTTIEEMRHVAGEHLHLHPHISQDAWLLDLSRYDAGWLHYFDSDNGGDLRRAKWNDLNYPARLAAYIAAGLPILAKDNQGSIVAVQTLLRSKRLGLLFTNAEQLHAQLSDPGYMAELRANVWRQRELFTFDFHVDRLVAFLRHIIANHRPR